MADTLSDDQYARRNMFRHNHQERYGFKNGSNSTVHP